MDYGKKPSVNNIPQMTLDNTDYRNTVWTGDYLQMTLMSIPIYSDIGPEIHKDTDQMIRIERGMAMVEMGPSQKQMNMRKRMSVGDVLFVPAGTWHNIINIGKFPLKLSSIYGPPHHPFGTIHRTKMDALQYSHES